MRSSLLLFGLSLLTLVPAAGCFGETTLDVGSETSGHSADTASDDAGTDAPSIALPVNHGAPFNADVIAAAKATCNAPHGPLDTVSTFGALEAVLVGDWYLCSTSAPGVDTVASLEFTPDGEWFYLVDDGNGGLMRGQGADDQGTYQLTDGSGAYVDLDAGADTPTNGLVARYTSTGGLHPDFTAFETGPKRLKIEEGTAAYEEWFVFLGASIQ